MATTKRATLPGAETFFRPTVKPETTAEPEQQQEPELQEPEATTPPPAPVSELPVQSDPPRDLREQVQTSDSSTKPLIDKSMRSPSDSTTKRSIEKTTSIQVPEKTSGRERHDEKVTFYCTREELLALERARLALRELGASADRGRIVREAVLHCLADLEGKGETSILGRRLARKTR